MKKLGMKHRSTKLVFLFGSSLWSATAFNFPLAPQSLRIAGPLMLATFSACGSLMGPGLSEDAKGTIQRVTQTFIGTVATGNEIKLADQVSWEDYLGTGDERISHQEFSNQLRAFREKFPLDNPHNPLLHLRVVKVTGSGSRGKIYLQKSDNESAPEIWVKLVWTGTGWVVIEDNLFGKNKLVSQYLATR